MLQDEDEKLTKTAEMQLKSEICISLSKIESPQIVEADQNYSLVQFNQLHQNKLCVNEIAVIDQYMPPHAEINHVVQIDPKKPVSVRNLTFSAHHTVEDYLELIDMPELDDDDKKGNTFNDASNLSATCGSDADVAAVVCQKSTRKSKKHYCIFANHCKRT